MKTIICTVCKPKKYLTFHNLHENQLFVQYVNKKKDIQSECHIIIYCVQNVMRVM